MRHRLDNILTNNCPWIIRGGIAQNREGLPFRCATAFSKRLNAANLWSTFSNPIGLYMEIECGTKAA